MEETALVQYKKFDTKRCFGIELEVNRKLSLEELVAIVRRADTKKECIGSSHYQQDAGNNYWHVKFDRSCGNKSQEGGWEVASYKASGAKDLIKISNMGTTLKNAGAEVNDNCGYHIHAEIADYDSVKAATLVAYWMKIEKIIAEILPKNRRSNVYCRFLSDIKLVSASAAKEASTFWAAVRPLSNEHPERRVALNMCNFAYGSSAKRTAELRLPEGTLDSKDIKNWARLFINFVTHVKKQPFPGNVTPVDNLLDAATILGLHNESPYFILSKGLYETKTWFFSRAKKFSSKKTIVSEADNLLGLLIPHDESAPSLDAASAAPKTPSKPKKKRIEWSSYDDETF